MVGKSLGLGELEPPLGPRLDGFDRLELLQHLDPGLCLAGFRRLVAEPVDEGLQVLGGALVGLSARFLLPQPLDPHRLVRGVVPRVPPHRAVLH